MNSHYNTSYTKDDVLAVLKRIKECVQRDRYTVALNEKRKANRSFINKYRVYDSVQKEILLGLEYYDFCYSLRNTHKGFEHETLYVFIPRLRLSIDDSEETVYLYIKVNIIEDEDGESAIIISFHEAESDFDYLFDRPEDKQ